MSRHKLKGVKEITEVLISLQNHEPIFDCLSYEVGVEEALKWAIGEIPDEEFMQMFVVKGMVEVVEIRPPPIYRRWDGNERRHFNVLKENNHV